MIPKTKSHIWKMSPTSDSLETIYKFTTGTFKIASLESVTYDQLVAKFGEPSINVPSGDNKIQVEWVFVFDGKPFTIYDWKTFDRDYTLQELTTWSIGGKERDSEFFEALRESFNTALVL
jgi:hypothetical protein